MEQEEAQNLVNSYTNLADGTSSTKVELSVDEVIDEYIGSFWFSQLLHVFLVSLAWMFDSQTTLVTIFTDAQPASWMCKPGSVSCDASSGGGSVCGLEPGTWEWVGGATTSVIAEWDLVCDRKFLAAIPASLFFIGSLLGSAIYGHLADAWLGRKRTMLVACVLTSATSYFTSLAPNIWIYTFLRFANGFVRSGIGICCLVLSTEAVGHRWRGQVGQYGFLFFTAGFLSLPFIAYPTRACWRNLYKIISLFPILCIILFVPFVSESPRWLLVRGRTEEALDVLKNFARLNGKKLPSNLSLSNPSLPKISSASEGENREYITADVDKGLCRTEWAAKRIITVMLAGFGVGFVYYGIQLNVENLSLDLYFTAALNAMMEIPAVFFGSVLLGFMDRHRLLSLSAYAAGISCILCIVFSHQDIEILSKSIGSWVQLLIEAIGFMAASTAFDVMYIYCVELFPTNVRNYAVSLLHQALMLGASIAPLLVAVGRLSPWLSFVIFGALSIFSGLLSLWLPETRNSPLYDTLKQQEDGEGLNGHSEDFCVLNK